MLFAVISYCNLETSGSHSKYMFLSLSLCLILSLYFHAIKGIWLEPIPRHYFKYFIFNVQPKIQILNVI